ncbi:MAG: thioredoxin family protein [Candidatus Dormiibacterota bacterium]
MSGRDGGSVDEHRVVSHEKWLSERTALLAAEKEFTRRRDDLSRQRRELAWEPVETPYVFDAPSGEVTLSDLFGTRSQLIVYHFMFSPEWDEGCPHCSFWADNFNGIDVHLSHRDVSFVAISRASLEKIEAFKARMRWNFTWVSSAHSDFNFDFNASFTEEQARTGTAFFNYGLSDPGPLDREGASVFYKSVDGTIYHTYSTYGRGIDMLNGAYHYLDLVPKGRDEDNLEFTQAWVRHHDRYDV